MFGRFDFNNVTSFYFIFVQSGDKMDWIVSSTVLLRGPMCLLILFVGEKIGLKRWLHISSVLAIGGKRNYLIAII